MKAIVPAALLAAWPEPNYAHPERRGPELTIVAIALLAIASVFVALRVYVRAFMLRSFGIDDWLITIGMLPAVALAVASVISTYYGWNEHMWDQRPEWYSPSELISWIIQLLYILNMFFSKTSLLFSYLRINPNKHFRLVVIITIGIVTAWFIGCFFSTVFSCRPVQQYWLTRTGVGCSDDGTRLLACTIINIVTDILVIAIPVRTVWHIQIPRREKTVLVMLMSIGLVAVIASVIRTVWMSKALDTYDTTWWCFYVWLWTCVECDLAIICACVPTLRPISKRLFGLVPFLRVSQRSGSNRTRTRVHSEPLVNLTKGSFKVRIEGGVGRATDDARTISQEQLV
ncbi:hypothetical protein MBLNU459_g3308t1 [Dothideomycetes sp. NU459]